MANDDQGERVVIVDYDYQWPTAFEQEKALLAQALDHDFVEIHHIGSTSVPGLAAKPIIDILVVVPRFAPLEEYRRRLEPLGYHHKFHLNEPVRLFFYNKGPQRTYHLHIVEYGTWEHRRHLLFRDYLRTHPDIAQEYERLKRRLASKFADNRPVYTASKRGFVRAVIAMAAAELSLHA